MVLNHPDGHSYVTDITTGTCCRFAMHLGAVLPDWLARSNATYVDDLEDADHWVCDGQYTNNYSCSKDDSHQPIR
jgi:hypothetical protein